MAVSERLAQLEGVLRDRSVDYKILKKSSFGDERVEVVIEQAERVELYELIGLKLRGKVKIILTKNAAIVQKISR